MPAHSYGSQGHDELIACLQRRGINVDHTGINNDVRKGYLPDRTAQVGFDFALKRATRLYRLRKLGVKGDLLRFMLFLADGWGWNSIRESCLEAYDKAFHIATLGVTEAVRKPTFSDVSVDADSVFAKHQQRIQHYLPQEATELLHEETLATILGFLLFGKALPNGKVTLWLSAAKKLVPWISALVPDQYLEAGINNFLTQLGTPEERRSRIARASGDSATHAARELRSFLRTIRGVVRQAGHTKTPSYKPGHPLNLFGALSHKRDVWSNGPLNITASQFLGLFVCFAVTHVQLEQASPPLIPPRLPRTLKRKNPVTT